MSSNNRHSRRQRGEEPEQAQNSKKLTDFNQRNKHHYEAIQEVFAENLRTGNEPTKELFEEFAQDKNIDVKSAKSAYREFETFKFLRELEEIAKSFKEDTADQDRMFDFQTDLPLLAVILCEKIFKFRPTAARPAELKFAMDATGATEEQLKKWFTEARSIIKIRENENSPPQNDFGPPVIFQDPEVLAICQQKFAEFPYFKQAFYKKKLAPKGATKEDVSKWFQQQLKIKGSQYPEPNEHEDRHYSANLINLRINCPGTWHFFKDCVANERRLTKAQMRAIGYTIQRKHETLKNYFCEFERMKDVADYQKLLATYDVPSLRFSKKSMDARTVALCQLAFEKRFRRRRCVKKPVRLSQHAEKFILDNCNVSKDLILKWVASENDIRNIRKQGSSESMDTGTTEDSDGELESEQEEEEDEPVEEGPGTSGLIRTVEEVPVTFRPGRKRGGNNAAEERPKPVVFDDPLDTLEDHRVPGPSSSSRVKRRRSLSSGNRNPRPAKSSRTSRPIRNTDQDHRNLEFEVDNHPMEDFDNGFYENRRNEPESSGATRSEQRVDGASSSRASGAERRRNEPKVNGVSARRQRSPSSVVSETRSVRQDLEEPEILRTSRVIKRRLPSEIQNENPTGPNNADPPPFKKSRFDAELEDYLKSEEFQEIPRKMLKITGILKTGGFNKTVKMATWKIEQMVTFFNEKVRKREEAFDDDEEPEDVPEPAKTSQNCKKGIETDLMVFMERSEFRDFCEKIIEINGSLNATQLPATLKTIMESLTHWLRKFNDQNRSEKEAAFGGSGQASERINVGAVVEEEQQKSEQGGSSASNRAVEDLRQEDSGANGVSDERNPSDPADASVQNEANDPDQAHQVEPEVQASGREAPDDDAPDASESGNDAEGSEAPEQEDAPENDPEARNVQEDVRILTLSDEVNFGSVEADAEARRSEAGSPPEDAEQNPEEEAPEDSENPIQESEEQGILEVHHEDVAAEDVPEAVPEDSEVAPVEPKVVASGGEASDNDSEDVAPEDGDTEEPEAPEQEVPLEDNAETQEDQASDTEASETLRGESEEQETSGILENHQEDAAPEVGHLEDDEINDVGGPLEVHEDQKDSDEVGHQQEAPEDVPGALEVHQESLAPEDGNSEDDEIIDVEGPQAQISVEEMAKEACRRLIWPVKETDDLFRKIRKKMEDMDKGDKKVVAVRKAAVRKYTGFWVTKIQGIHRPSDKAPRTVLQLNPDVYGKVEEDLSDDVLGHNVYKELYGSITKSLETYRGHPEYERVPYHIGLHFGFDAWKIKELSDL